MSCIDLFRSVVKTARNSLSIGDHESVRMNKPIIKFAIIIVALTVSFATASCNTPSTSPDQQAESERGVGAVDSTDAEDVGEDVILEIEDPLCAEVSAVRTSESNHSTLAAWVQSHTSPDMLGDTDAPRLVIIAWVFTDAHLEILAAPPSDDLFDSVKVVTLRNLTFQIMEVMCGFEENHGELGDGCGIWHEHRSGGMSSYEFLRVYLQKIDDESMDVFWQDHTAELGLLFFAYHDALNTQRESGLVDRVEGLRMVIDDICTPQ